MEMSFVELKVGTTWGTIEIGLLNGRVVRCALPFLMEPPDCPFAIQKMDDDPAAHFVAAMLTGKKARVPPLGKLGGTAFQQAVWQAIAQIAPCKTQTYGELARAIGRPTACRALANTILQQSGATQAIQELKQLRQENAELKRQLAARPKALAPEKTVTQTIPKTAKPVAAKSAQPVQPAHQVYTVVSGDTLTKIAKKFYGNSDYDPIYEANKDRMKSPSDLRVGQTLVIPMPAK